MPGITSVSRQSRSLAPPQLVHESGIKVPYNWSAGEALSRFLTALRDEGKIMGARCPACRLVYVPPRKSCGACFVDCAEWVETGPGGVLESFTQALYDSPAHPRARPVYGLIRLDGAGTALLHLLEGPVERLRAGMRVEAVFAPERKASILDILHFRTAP